jgi:hypothetical protein
LGSGAMENPGMRALWSAVITIVLATIAGCASPATEPQALRGVGPCLPPEMSSQFFFWPVVAFRPMNLPTEDGDTIEASWVVYRRGRTSVAAIWVHADLVAVDPSPETEEAEWVDVSLVTPVDGKLVLRRTAGTPCQWERWENPADASLLDADRVQAVRLKLAWTMTKVFLPAGS